MTLLQQLSLLWRTFTPVEEAVLNAVLDALPPPSRSLTQQQVASVNKVQRLFDWTEINFYCIHGKSRWPESILFPNRGEFELAAVTYSAGDQNFRTSIWSVRGVVFSFITRPSVKAHSFAPVSNIAVTLVGDPQALGILSVNLIEYLPESFLGFCESHATSEAVNGWDILLPDDTYLIHLTAGDYVVLASREGAEWLLAPKILGTTEIHYCLTDGEPTLVGDDFRGAVAQR